MRQQRFKTTQGSADSFSHLTLTLGHILSEWMAGGISLTKTAASRSFFERWNDTDCTDWPSFADSGPMDFTCCGSWTLSGGPFGSVLRCTEAVCYLCMSQKSSQRLLIGTSGFFLSNCKFFSEDSGKPSGVCRGCTPLPCASEHLWKALLEGISGYLRRSSGGGWTDHPQI